MPVTVLAKTDVSLGREKREQPLNDLIPVDLDYYERAEELERQKDALIEHAAAINSLEASLSSVPGAILYEMPIATGSVGTVARYRGAGDTGTPGGTPVVSVVTQASYPSGNALRLRATGLTGGVVWPILHGLALPNEYIVEIEISGMDADGTDYKAIVMPFADFFGGSNEYVRGLAMEIADNVSSIDRRAIEVASGPFARSSGTNIGDSCSIGNQPDLPAGPLFCRYHVRRAGGFTPARWQVCAEHRAHGAAGQPQTWGISGVDTARTAWDGLTFDEIAIGVFGEFSGNMNVDISRLRIRSV